MSTANTILDTLKDDLEDYIKVSRGYNTDLAECKRGIYAFDDMLNKPSIAFWCYKNELEEALMGKAQLRILRIYMYFYTNSISEIHDLIEDVEGFLFNDFTYKSDIQTGDSTTYEGGISDPAVIAELEIAIKFTREL